MPGAGDAIGLASPAMHSTGARHAATLSNHRSICRQQGQMAVQFDGADCDWLENTRKKIMNIPMSIALIVR
jgi:hypothetical protein